MLMLVEVEVGGGWYCGDDVCGGMMKEFVPTTATSRRRHTTTVNSSQRSINCRAICLLHSIS